MKHLLFATAALALLMNTAGAQADNRRDDDHRGHDRGHEHNSRNHDSFGRRVAERHWDQRGHDHSSVSVNLSFGNVAGSRWQPAYRAPLFPRINAFNSFGHRYNTRQPVVVYQNNYIEQESPVTVVRSSPSAAMSETSLLRDVSGRCYEREFDSYGNETIRRELPASMCDF